MIRVAALTSGKNAPASRFRVRQHIPALKALGIHVDEYPPFIDAYASVPLPVSAGTRSRLPRPAFASAAWRLVKLATRVPGLIGSVSHQITWLEREILPGRYTLESCLKGPVVLDIDDAIWLTAPHGRESLERSAARAAVVVAGNTFIAEWFSSKAKRIEVLPTAVDTDLYIPEAGASRQPFPFVVGWIGSSGNLPYLHAIEDALAAFLRARPASQMLVVADKPPHFQTIPAHQIHFVPWSAADEVRLIQSMDVGIMPLPDSEWTRGKCGFKMLQYFSCGVLAVASPVGVNREILARGDIGIAANSAREWTDALVYLHDERQAAKQMGGRGRTAVEQHYSVKAVAPLLARIFNQL